MTREAVRLVEARFQVLLHFVSSVHNLELWSDCVVVAFSSVSGQYYTSSALPRASLAVLRSTVESV